MLKPLRALALETFLILIFTAAAGTKDNPEYTQIGHDIIVGPNQEVGEVTCIACSIRIRGKVAGEVTTVGGSIFIDDQAEVSGEVTAVAGNIRLERNTKVAGGVTVVGGEIRRDPGAQIGGDVTSVGGRAWMPVILVAPFLFIGLLVAFVVWLVRHFRKPATAVAT
jgi:cytoskeletal protein CcmA (bactofilin family)